MKQKPTYNFAEIVDLILEADNATLQTIIDLLSDEPDRYTADQRKDILEAVKARRKRLEC